MPAPRRFFLAIPYPDAPVCEIDPQLPARAVAQDAARPVARAEPLRQALHRDRCPRGLPLARRTAAAGLGRRNRKFWLFGPDPLGAMNVGDKYLVAIVLRAGRRVPCRFRHPLRPSVQIAPGHRRTVARLVRKNRRYRSMKPAKTSAIPSTNGPVSHHPDTLSRDELALSFRLTARSVRWRPIDSTYGSRVKPENSGSSSIA
jgi:hypothetical protein